MIIAVGEITRIVNEFPFVIFPNILDLSRAKGRQSLSGFGFLFCQVLQYASFIGATSLFGFGGGNLVGDSQTIGSVGEGLRSLKGLPFSFFHPFMWHSSQQTVNHCEQIQ